MLALQAPCQHLAFPCLAWTAVAYLLCWGLLQVGQLLHLEPVSLVLADLLPAHASTQCRTHTHTKTHKDTQQDVL